MILECAQFCHFACLYIWEFSSVSKTKISRSRSGCL